MAMEIWKSVVGFESQYEVSDLGRVRRDAIFRHAKWNKERFGIQFVLKQGLTPDGYPRVTLGAHGSRGMRRVHKLVSEAFIGPCPDGREVNHKDGNKLNNRPSNLEYITHAQNIRHAEDSGLRLNAYSGCTGTAHWKAILSPLAASVIRRLKGRVTQRELAEIFGVAKCTITRIHLNQSWTRAA